MRSMTGFGRAEIERGKMRVAAEVRTLNQRFFELKLNLPRTWGEHEARNPQAGPGRYRARPSRALRPMHPAGPPPTTLRVNDGLAALYVKELAPARAQSRSYRQAGGRASCCIAPRFSRSAKRRPTPAPACNWRSPRSRVHSRRSKPTASARAKHCARDFIGRINTITEAVPQIERLAEASRSEILANFQTRLRDLIGDLAVNEKRLYEEASDAAQRADITEEVTRLRVHLRGLRELVESEGAVGKQIEFLLQEVNREINTMGAKSQSAALSRDDRRTEGRGRKDARAGAERRVGRRITLDCKGLAAFIGLIMEHTGAPRRGIIFILSAPSGAGKTTISRAALKAISGLEASVSLTTRRPRNGEAEGTDYLFVSEEEFIRRREADELAEWARVFEASYGTPRARLDECSRRRPRHPARHRHPRRAPD